MSEYYVSGTWGVRSGREAEFIKRWTDFTGWAAQEIPGALSFLLLRDEANPSRFISLGIFDAESSVVAWRNSAGFAERFPKVRSLCDEFSAHDYTLAAQAGSLVSH